MQKIVDGVLYDTEQAEEVAHFSSHHPKTDFQWFEERLYRTEKGSWFLYGHGHAMTKYARSVPGGGASGPGKRLVVMSEEEVKSWLERHDFIDVYKEYFDLETA